MGGGYQGRACRPSSDYWLSLTIAIVTDGVYRAFVQSLLAAGYFIIIHGLVTYIRLPIIHRKIIRRNHNALAAFSAAIIYIKVPQYFYSALFLYLPIHHLLPIFLPSHPQGIHRGYTRRYALPCTAGKFRTRRDPDGGLSNYALIITPCY